MTISQYIREDVNAIDVPIATQYAINNGDFLALVAGEALPAVDFTWAGSLALTQYDFVASFLGHTIQQKEAGVPQVYGNTTSNILTVSTSGVYEADLNTPTTLKVGEFVGMAKDTGDNLLSQTVIKVASLPLAIGVVVESGVSLSRCRFRILPTAVPFAQTPTTTTVAPTTSTTSTTSTSSTT